MTIHLASVDLRERDEARILQLTVRGKLTSTDYDLFVPELERRIDQHGKVCLLIDLEDFAGWTAGALWKDTKFEARHWNDIEKIAVVGEGKLEKGLAVFARPFTTASVEFFERNRRVDAVRWLHGAGAAAG